jgi:hypothetical protein
MCVAQFRDYVNASKFQTDWEGQNRFEKDLENPDIEVSHYRVTENGQGVYYKTDLKKMRRLAEQGNAYAINHFK